MHFCCGKLAFLKIRHDKNITTKNATKLKSEKYGNSPESEAALTLFWAVMAPRIRPLKTHGAGVISQQQAKKLKTARAHQAR